MLAFNIIDVDVFLQSHEDLTCGFWDYYANEDGGGWSTEGCTLSFENDRVVCKCDHLTNFAVLIVSFRNFFGCVSVQARRPRSSSLYI